MSETQALIEKARAFHQDSRSLPGTCQSCHRVWPCYTARMADALEAATVSDGWPAQQRRIAARIAERYEQEAP